MSDVTRLPDAAAARDRRATPRPLPPACDGLRALAAAPLAPEGPRPPLDAPALVHEAFLRLVGDKQFYGRGHFSAAAAEAMRRTLVETARRKRREKHGGRRERVELPDVAARDPGD